jgi:hypothetical protein
MTLTKALITTSAIVLLSACAVTHQEGASKPEEASGGIFGMTKTADIEVDNESALKGRDKVIIAGYNVVFFEEKKASNKGGGGLMGSGFGGKSSANMDLVGVGNAEFQAATDAAYGDFIARLQKAGYTVYDRKALVESKEFSGAASDPSPKREESTWLGGGVTQTKVAPTAIGKIYDPMGGFAFSNPVGAATNFANTNNVPVLFVTYLVDFANKAGGHGGYFSNSSSLEVAQGISIAPGSAISFVGGGGGTFDNRFATVKLGQAVYSEEKFAEVTATTSDAAKGLEVATNVIGLLGGIGSNQSRSFEVKADPAKYQAVTTQTLASANEKLVSTMASHK